MPIYEYRCQACGAELEKLQKISDPVLLECPECGRESLVKLVSASSFRLKGGGWYESDFKTGKKKNGLAESEGNAESSTASVAAGSVDKTPGSTNSAGEASASKSGNAESAPSASEKKPSQQASTSSKVKTQESKPVSKDS